VTRVLLADDEALVREGLRLILEREDDLEVVGEAVDGEDALREARVLQPDVVLMDLRMPRLDGVEATRRLAALAPPRPRVLVLTTFDGDEEVYRALRAGASGYLLKDVPRVQLTAAIRTVARGEALLAPAITRRFIERFVHRPPPGVAVPDALRELTERELEVLRLVARGRSNGEIAAALHLSEATVKTHLAHVFSKLCLRDRVQAVVLAYESGLVEPGGDEGAAI
jgi:DNA-binding NarL/FixJ family response regulator